jgi:two-component system, chemotaxis family, protein-glutamate methylesterase/glutaminase
MAQVKQALVAAPPVVALVGSAGALEAMAEVLEELDEGFPASVVVLLHLAPTHRSVLAEILSRRSALPVKQAAEGDMLEAGKVHVAPAAVHLTVRSDGSLALDSRPPVHFLRPSVDLLLESMADACGPRSVVVVLSGGGSDGAVGAVALKAAGGTVLAQDEASAQHYGMPGAAIDAGAVDRVVDLHEIARTVVEYVEALPHR